MFAHFLFTKKIPKLPFLLQKGLILMFSLEAMVESLLRLQEECIVKVIETLTTRIAT